MQRHRLRIFALLSVLVLITTIISACGAGGGTATPGGNTQTTITLKIGSELPTSGQDESGGKPVENAVRLAIKQANAQNLVPGVHFEIVAKNDVGVSGAHDATVGAKNVQDLVGDNQVVGIVGPLNSSVAAAELPISNNATIAQISPSNTND